MRISLTALFFVLTVQAAAAQNIPASNVFDTQTTVATHSQQPMVSFTSVEKNRPRVFDRKFFMLAGIATAATMLDVATTSHCMATYADCQEGNPLLGSHPSQAKLYGVSFSMLGGQLLASAWIRRKTPNGKLWMVPPIIATSGHGLAAALNVRTMHQLSSGQ
jgi:hypothetical protein